MVCHRKMAELVNQCALTSVQTDLTVLHIRLQAFNTEQLVRTRLNAACWNRDTDSRAAFDQLSLQKLLKLHRLNAPQHTAVPPLQFDNVGNNLVRQAFLNQSLHHIQHTRAAGVPADTGLDVLTHAVEAYVSVLANDFTDGLALQAIKLVFQYLERSYKHGAADPEAREHMHNASTIAGMAFANAFLGINHSMAHKIGGKYHVPHGRANAILLPHVIRYNGTRPQKTATWPKYNYYKADLKYQEIARTLGLPCSTPAEGVESFARACHELAVNVGIKMSLKEQGIDEKTFLDGRKELAMMSFEDQCTPANPRLAMVADMEEILTKAYYGE